MLCEPSEAIYEQAITQIKEAFETLRRPIAKDADDETEEEKEVVLP